MADDRSRAAGTVSETSTLRGTVISFDPERALGTIADPFGNETNFHSIAIADDTRMIEVGQAVVFRRAPGRLGQWEGSDIVKL